MVRARVDDARDSVPARRLERVHGRGDVVPAHDLPRRVDGGDAGKVDDGVAPSESAVGAPAALGQVRRDRLEARNPLPVERAKLVPVRQLPAQDRPDHTRGSGDQDLFQ